MFFDSILLHPQHKARFGVAWIAATIGTKSIAKREFRSVDVVALCEELIKFIQTESTNPRKRFSLRLSAILVNGVVKIHRQQVVFVLDEAVKYVLTARAPAHVELPGFEPETPPTPIPKVKKRPKKRPVEETPEFLQLPAVLAEQLVPPEPVVFHDATKARIDEITIRDEIPPKVGEIFGEEDFGPLALQQVEDLTQRPDLQKPQPEHVDVPAVPEIPSELKLPPEKELTARKSPESEVVPPEVITIQAEIHAERGQYIEVPEKIQAPQIEVAEEQPQIVPAPEEQLPQIEEVQQAAPPEVTEKPERVEEIPTPIKEKKKRADRKKAEKPRVPTEEELRQQKEYKKREAIIRGLLVRSRPRKWVPIDRNTIEGEILVSPELVPAAVPFWNVRTKDILDIFWKVAEEEEGGGEPSAARISSTLGVLGLSATLRSIAVSDIARPSEAGVSAISEPSPVVLPISGRPVMESTPLKRKKTLEETREEELARNGHRPSKRKLIEVTTEPAAPELEVPTTEIVPPQPELALSVPPPEVPEQPTEHIQPLEIYPQPVTEAPPSIEMPTEAPPRVEVAKKERHQRVVDMVMTWDYSLKKLTIDEICKELGLKAVKRTMAILFGDLISKYCNLVSLV